MEGRCHIPEGDRSVSWKGPASVCANPFTAFTAFIAVPADRAGSSAAAVRTSLWLADDYNGAAGAGRKAGRRRDHVLLLGLFRKFCARHHSGADLGRPARSIPVALALSLPEGAAKSALLSATYAVVLFT